MKNYRNLKHEVFTYTICNNYMKRKKEFFKYTSQEVEIFLASVSKDSVPSFKSTRASVKWVTVRIWRKGQLCENYRI